MGLELAKSIVHLGELTDVTKPESVQILVSPDKSRLWVNVDGVCLLRCCQIERLELEVEA